MGKELLDQIGSARFAGPVAENVSFSGRAARPLTRMRFMRVNVRISETSGDPIVGYAGGLNCV
jgi:hypothetical protein